MIQREIPVRAHRRAEGPVRTCVGCRKRELAVELLRVVALGGGEAPGGTALVVDTAGRLPGRGVWLHPHRQCLHEAIRRRAFARALRITDLPDTSAVVEHWNALDGPATEQAAKNMSTP